MVTDITHHRRSGAPQVSTQEIIATAQRMGAVNAKVIPSHSVFLGNWTRLKCQFGCPHFGRLFTCPTFTPTTQEMSDILLDYEKAVVVEAGQAEAVHGLVLNLENHFREMGFNKAFALCAQPCNLCEICTVETHCQHPDKARPTLQGCGVDLPRTLMHMGWNTAARQEPCSSQHTIGLVLID